MGSNESVRQRHGCDSSKTVRRTIVLKITLRLLCGLSVIALSLTAILTTDVLVPAGPAGATGSYVSYFAGGGSYTVDGVPALSSTGGSPAALATDSAGNVFYNVNSEIREVSASNGLVKTVAGIASNGFSGDGGPATSV